MDRSSQKLDQLLQNYREALPDFEPGANFMPSLWEKIEARRVFTLRFKRLTQVFVGASAAICLLLMGMNFNPPAQNPTLQSRGGSYVDVLMAANPTDNLLALGIGADQNQ